MPTVSREATAEGELYLRWQPLHNGLGSSAQLIPGQDNGLVNSAESRSIRSLVQCVIAAYNIATGRILNDL